jgi:hypothetical protein
VPKKGTIDRWKITVSSGYSIPKKIPLFFHTMYLKNCLLHKWKSNTTSGYIFPMKIGKKKSFPYHGRLEISFSGT